MAKNTNDEFWSEILKLKYKKQIVNGKLIGLIFQDNVYYSIEEMNISAQCTTEQKIENHLIKKIFDGCLEALENIL